MIKEAVKTADDPQEEAEAKIRKEKEKTKEREKTTTKAKTTTEASLQQGANPQVDN